MFFLISAALRLSLVRKSLPNSACTKNGHGFGMHKQNLPTDHWIERFADWLDLLGLLNK